VPKLQAKLIVPTNAPRKGVGGSKTKVASAGEEGRLNLAVNSLNLVAVAGYFPD